MATYNMFLWRTDKKYLLQLSSVTLLIWSTAICVTLVKLTIVYQFYSSALIMTFQTNTSPVHRSLLSQNSIFQTVLTTHEIFKSMKYFTRFKVL